MSRQQHGDAIVVLVFGVEAFAVAPPRCARHDIVGLSFEIFVFLSPATVKSKGRGKRYAGGRRSACLG